MTDQTRLRARYRRILRFALRYMVQEWWFEIALPRVGLARLSRRGRDARFLGIARAFRALAADLGGLMIKVGQFMSTRMDVLPPGITDELASLQDEVDPVPFDAIRQLVESEFGGVPLQRVFEDFEETPVAAASLGQAHRARLQPSDAQELGFAGVVVKVQRPGIEQVVDIDLSALRKVAGWLSRVRFISDRVDVPAIVEEFAQTSLQEVDYLHEAANAERFGENFEGDPRVSCPVVAWERTTRRVLTLSDVTALKVSDIDALRAAGIDPADVASDFGAVMLDQFFLDGFFHADPHPGNLFVTPRAGGADADARPFVLTFIDFGMMGEVPDTLRQEARTLLVAIAARDGEAIVGGMQDLGVLLPGADTDRLARAMTELFGRFGGMDVSDVEDLDPRELEDFAEKFGDVMRTMPFQLPEDFLLIFRAVSLVSGLCSALDPDFDIWNAVQPYIQQLARDEGGGAVREALGRAGSALQTAAGLPGRLDHLATAAERGELSFEVPRTDRQLRRLEGAVRRIGWAILFAALFIGGVLLRGSDPGWGAAAMGASVIPLAATLVGGRGAGGRGAGGRGAGGSRQHGRLSRTP